MRTAISIAANIFAIEQRTHQCHSAHFPTCIFYGSNLVHCVILYLFFNFFYLPFYSFTSCVRLILFIFPILVDSRYYYCVRFIQAYSPPIFFLILLSVCLFLYKILTNKLDRAFGTFHQNQKKCDFSFIFFIVPLVFSFGREQDRRKRQTFLSDFTIFSLVAF